jgi:diguanylate cyclase (GGDEF)-like protein/PAS domain S-box-containing protein
MPNFAAPAVALNRRATHWVPFATGFLAVAVLVVLLAGLSIWQERDRQRERAVAATQNLARLLEAHVADVLTKADVLLQAAAVQWRETGLPPGADLAPADKALRALATAAPELQDLRVADADGHWRVLLGQGSAPPPADSEAFQRARAVSEPMLIVTGPLRHREGSPWVLELSRGVRAADGGFAGLISVDLPVTRFDALFSTIDLGDDGAATIRTDRLALVYRRPWPREGQAAVGSSNVSAQLREAISLNPLAGDYQAPTALDGIARINAYRKVQDYPLYLLVGLPEDDFPQGWNAVDGGTVALALATLGMAALATLLLHRASRRELDATQRQLSSIVASSTDAIISETLDGVITSWNPGAEAIFGYPAAEIIGHPLMQLVPPERRDELQEVLGRVHRGERVAHFETERLCRDGRRITLSMSISPLLDAEGRVIGASRIARDITEQKAMAEEVRQLAFHDPLTRLPNRRLLLDRLKHAQQTSRRLGTHGAVLFLDLDRFKRLNDRLGHDAGDHVLVVVAQRLACAVRETDTVARHGGDEFVVVCENLGADAAVAEARVAALEAKISEAVAQPVALHGELVDCSVSIGHRLFLGTGDDLDALVADADSAMYRHKQRLAAARVPAPAPDNEAASVVEAAGGEVA